MFFILLILKLTKAVWSETPIKIGRNAITNENSININVSTTKTPPQVVKSNFVFILNNDTMIVITCLIVEQNIKLIFLNSLKSTILFTKIF